MSSTQEFRKIWLSSFISQSGSHFLTIALSAFTLVSTGSPVQAALIFVLSFMPSILVSTRLGTWIDRKISRILLIRNELISIVSTLACALCIYEKLPIVFLCIILAFRSLLLFIGRAASMKWLKLISPPELQSNRVKVFFLGFFLSTALAGVLAGLVLHQASVWWIALWDILTYLGSIVLLLTLRPLATQESLSITHDLTPNPRLLDTLGEISQLSQVRFSFLIVCLSQALFQGAYSTLVSVLPIQKFLLGMSGIGQFQLAASIGITAGFLINWLLPHLLSEKSPSSLKKACLMTLVGAAALLAAASSTQLGTSWTAFVLFNWAYECLWLHHSSEFFRASPKASAARYQFTLSSSAAFLMSITTLGYSAAIEAWGTETGIGVVLVAGLIISFGLTFLPRNSLDLKLSPERGAP